jgi:hypothetical protein
MKITKNQLRQIIKEEAINLLSESNSFDSISKLVNGEQRKSPYYNLSDEERPSKDVLFLYSILNNKNLGLSLSNQEKFDILNNFLNGDKKFDILNVDLKQIPFIEDLRDKYSMELKKELNESIKKIVREGFKSLLNENRFQIGANRFQIGHQDYEKDMKRHRIEREK